jgi:hypothetical protein
MYTINHWHVKEFAMQEHENRHPPGDPKLPSAAMMMALSVIFASIQALPQAFEQYPRGAAVVSGLILVGLFCWVYVNRLKFRRR